VIIQHAVWLYLRFTLSYRDVEELLAERGLDISYETVRCWVLKFGPMIARCLRRQRPQPSKGQVTDVTLTLSRLLGSAVPSRAGHIVEDIVLAIVHQRGRGRADGRVA